MALAAAALGTTAGTATAEPPHLTVPRVARAPQLDDFTAMDADDAPNGMAKVQGFVQRFPNDGEAVSERTVVYVGPVRCRARDARRRPGIVRRRVRQPADRWLPHQ